MIIRTAVLFTDSERRIGQVQVPETTFIIQHDDALFVRTAKGVRLSGGGIGVMFIETEPLVRQQLQRA